MEHREEIKYLDEKKTADLTGLSVFTLRNWRFIGRGLPYCKVGRSIRYSLEDILSFMEKNRIAPEEMNNLRPAA